MKPTKHLRFKEKFGVVSLFLFSTLLFFGITGTASATARTSAQTGNWASTSTWSGGVVPVDGDTVTIAAGHTVTIPNGTTVAIGDNSTTPTNAITLTSNTSPNTRLVVAGTLTLHGNVLINNRSILEVQGGGIIQFDPPATARYIIDWQDIGPVTPWGKLLGSATSWASPAIIRTKPGAAGLNGSINSYGNGVGLTVDLSYTQIDSLGAGYGANQALAISFANALNLNHVLITNSGPVRTASGTVSIDYLDMRYTTASSNWGYCMYISGAVSGTINHSVITSNHQDDALYIPSDDFTISNSTFGAGVQFDGYRDTLSNVNFAMDTANQKFYVEWPSKSGQSWNGGGVMVYDTTPNAHIITETGTPATGGTPSTTANDVRNIVVDGPAGSGDPGDGDFYIPQQAHTISHVILTNRMGNIDDGGGTLNSSMGSLDHDTLRNTDKGATQSSIALSELNYSANSLTSVKEMLFSKQYNSIGIATSATNFVKQASLYFDYLWWDSPVLPGRTNKAKILWNPGTNHNGSVELTQSSTGTVTVSTQTDASHLVLSSTSGIAVGDWLCHGACSNGSTPSTQRAAMVLAIPSSGNVTLGPNEDGVAGLPLAVAGQTLSIKPNLWASGKYGDDGKGLHEYYSDPGFISPDVIAATWDTSLGGNGTKLHAARELYKINGWDITGASAVYNSNYNWAAWLAYMRNGLTPTSPLLKGSYLGTPDGQDIGAVNVVDTHAPSVSITTPTSSATVSGSSVSLVANSTDDFDIASEGVQGVKFYYDNLSNQIGSEITVPSPSGVYTTSWNTTALSAGAHTVFAVSRDLAGNSTTSSSISVTVNNVPGAPTSVSATPLNSSSASISFSAPASNGGSSITLYTVTSSPGNVVATGGSSPITVSGLTTYTPYNFSVTATNSSGAGPSSSASNSITLQQYGFRGGSPTSFTPIIPTSQNNTNTPVTATTSSVPSSTGTEKVTIFLPEQRDLHVGVSPAKDIKDLQIFLNNQGFTVSNTGLGSKGNETSIFGQKTKTALMKFQKANKIVPATGYFGPKTRSVIKHKLGS